MKRSKKIAVTAAVIMIAVGLALSFCALAAMRFSFSEMNTLSFLTKTYRIDKDFSSISVDGAECNVRLFSSDDEECRVVCYESDKIYHSVAVENNTLTVKRHDDRAWYEHIGIYWGDMDIAIYLPQSEFEELGVKNLSGDIVIPDNFAFSSADIQSTSGDISFEAAVSGELSLKTVSGELYAGGTHPQRLNAQSTSGDITVHDVGTEVTLQVKTVSGDVELSDIKCRALTADTTSGEIDLSNVIADGTIHAKSVSGDVELQLCDAASLWLKTSSGDISGALLSEKIFLTDTSSGNVDVPRTSSGGQCEVTTTSGDIEFEIK